MDQSNHPISPHDLYARLGANARAMVVDVRSGSSTVDDDGLVMPASPRYPNWIEKWGKGLRSAAVIKLRPLARIKGTQ